jgi:CBS domain-containing protein
MRTASIGYRVADFLRRHPPFQYIDEGELLELVQDGRVQFHEHDEIIFQQGQARKRFVYVIQQGVVRLIQETARGEVLRDVRGEGDLLGIGRFLGDPAHRFTARTETDVILYAVPGDAFGALVKRNPRAARFLGAYFSVAATPVGLEAQDGRSEELRLGKRPVDWMGRLLTDLLDPVTCAPDATVRDAARALASSRSTAAVVADSDRVPVGLITPRLLSDRVATGEFPLDAPVRLVMDVLPPLARPGLDAGAYLIRMLESEREHVVLTRSDAPEAPLVGIVSRRDLTRVEAAAPLAIVDDMARAPDFEALAGLRAKAEEFLAAALSGPEAVRWLGSAAGAFNAAVLRRAVSLVEGALAAEGPSSPCLGHCWVFFGGAGRRELLTRYDLDYGLIYETPASGDVRAARAYFLELGRRVTAAMSACGFVTTGLGIVAGHPSACRSVAEWKHAFATWIRDPIASGLYRATSFFDLRPVCGERWLAQDLVRHIDALEDENPNFVRLLANDSMENLPPLTFFRGLVIDDEGSRAETLDLKRATLQPVVDVARALALDGRCRKTSTLGRLAGARAFTGDDEKLLVETSAAFGHALYHRARSGFSSGTDGNRVDPTKLTRFEQTLLKAGFRTVLHLMEYTARRYGLKPRR